jgi:hypothetical protein
MRMDFDTTESDGLEPISWKQFFEPFERSKLAFRNEIGRDQTSSLGTLVRPD